MFVISLPAVRLRPLIVVWCLLVYLGRRACTPSCISLLSRQGEIAVLSLRCLCSALLLSSDALAFSGVLASYSAPAAPSGR